MNDAGLAEIVITDRFSRKWDRFLPVGTEQLRFFFKVHMPRMNHELDRIMI